MPVDISITIKTEGKIFERGLEPGLINAFNEGLDVIAKSGEGFVKAQLVPGHGLITGDLRESVAGDIVSDLRAVVDAGEHIQGRNIVYAEWIERGRRGTKFRGYRMFAKARRRIETMPVAEIIASKVRKFFR